MTNLQTANSGLGECAKPDIDTENFMTYEDAERTEQREPACAQCVARFKFADKQKALLEKCLAFSQLHENFAVARWHERTSQYGSSDWHWVRYLRWIEVGLKKAAGLYCLSFEQMRALRGSVHLAIAAEVVSPDDRHQAINWLAYFSQFRAHLHNWHRSDNGHNIGFEILESLDEPLYVGSLNLEGAWSLSSKLRGKTMEQIQAVFQEDLDGTLEGIRADLACAHGGRMPRAALFRTALYNAVSVIQNNAEEWSQRAKNSTDSTDLLDLSSAIHDQVFLVDELLAMGCRSDDPNLRTIGGNELYRAIGAVRELIDWGECPALEQRMEQADQWRTNPSASHDDDWW